MMVPRRATEDLVLHVVRPEPGTVFVNKGTLIIIDLIGLCEYLYPINVLQAIEPH